MILYINTFITDKRLVQFFRGNLPNNNRLDIFKYSLASFAAVDMWSRVVINAELDNEYKSRQGELDEFVHKTFKDPIYSTKRISYQHEWQDDLNNKIMDSSDPMIWYCCNDDHIYLDHDTDLLAKVLEEAEADPYPYRSIYFSHFPELLRFAVNGSNCVRTANAIRWDWINIDSIQVMSKELLHAIWFNYDYGDAAMPRTDFHNRGADAPLTHFYLVPREQCRHFDGYSHVGMDINKCPPLTIPPGFFDRDIKIRYGYPDNNPACVNINLDKHAYTACDSNGTDYKLSLDKLPKVWLERISMIDRNPNYDERNDKDKCRAATIDTATCFGFPKTEWLVH